MVRVPRANPPTVLRSTSLICRQFHQRYAYKFFVRMLFQQLFSSYMYVEKAAKMMFVRKIRANDVDEIDTGCHVKINKT